MAIMNFIPSVWSEQLYQTLDAQYVAAAHCNRDFEGDIREKGDTVKICGIGDITVSDYTKNQDMSSPEALSDSVRELLIDQAKCFNFQIDDIDRAQAFPKLMQAAVQKAAKALAAEADTYILSLATKAKHQISDNALGDDKILDHLLAAHTLLMKENASNEDIVFELSPDVAGLLLKAKIATASDNSEQLEKGCLGSVAGCKVYVTNNLPVADSGGTTTYTCLARTKRSIAFAEQLSEIDAYRPELRFADAVKGLHLYGAKAVYPNEMVKMTFQLA